MRILLQICYRGYSVKGTFSSVNKSVANTTFLQDVLEKSILGFCPARRPKILLSTFTECDVNALSNAATVDFELPGKQKLGAQGYDVHWFKFNMNRILITTKRHLRLIDAKFVHDSFDPKLFAVERSYFYRFLSKDLSSIVEDDLSTSLSSSVSMPLLRSAIDLIHNRSLNYSAFTSPEARKLIENFHRTVQIRVEEHPPLFSNLKTLSNAQSFSLQLKTNNFLHQMVRRLTTDLIRVGQGHLSLVEFEKKFSTNVETHREEEILDARGLFLDNVRYDEQDFQRYVTFTTITTKGKTTKDKIHPFATIFTGEE